MIGVDLTDYILGHNKYGDDNPIKKRFYTQTEINLADELCLIFNNTYFELGMSDDAVEYYEEIEYYNKLNVLRYIVENKPVDEHTLEGVLSILSSRDVNKNVLKYLEICNEIIEKLNDLKRISSIVLIQDWLLSCFDRWNAKQSLPLLDKLKFVDESRWLEGYRDEIIEDIKAKGTDYNQNEGGKTS